MDIELVGDEVLYLGIRCAVNEMTKWVVWELDLGREFIEVLSNAFHDLA